MDVLTLKDYIMAVFYIVSLGAIYGRQEAVTRQLKIENDERKEELKGLASQMSSLTKDTLGHIEDLKKLFTTQDGEPRFVSYKAHDILQANCHRLLNARLQSLIDGQQEIEKCQTRLEGLVTKLTEKLDSL